MMKIQETWVNKTKGYSWGDSGWYEPFTDEKGRLFRSLQKEYGRCVSKVYIDQLQVNGKMEAIPHGWVFEKKRQYDDSRDFYVQETWVSIQEDEKGA